LSLSELVINLKTAKALGLTISQALQRAHRMSARRLDDVLLLIGLRFGAASDTFRMSRRDGCSGLNQQRYALWPSCCVRHETAAPDVAEHSRADSMPLGLLSQMGQ
jgi:hypothetical protein